MIREMILMLSPAHHTRHDHDLAALRHKFRLEATQLQRASKIAARSDLLADLIDRREPPKNESH